MGRDVRVRYLVHEVLDGNRVVTPIAWNSNKNWDGPANAKNLVRKIRGFEESTKPGGVNEHLGPTKVLSAQLVDTFTGTTKATYVAE
jgi:hypothetical protein